MSSACSGPGCCQRGPHLNIIEDQIEEGLRREEGTYAPLGDFDDLPFTTDGTPDESPDYALWQGYNVEVVDPLPQIADIELTDFGSPPEDWFDPDADTSFEDVFRLIFGEAFALLVERQRRYGPENIRQLGLYGVFTRIVDKMERIRHSFNGTMKNGILTVEEVDNDTAESLDDADFDAANYHLIRIALRRGEWGRPLEEEVVGWE